ncbi:MAG: beta-ketoacyl-ACP synthase III [Brumimicrobium sp.]|nr:beta-ketoacyl-ACP synthase III [Brumimicrobium sp.]
MNKVYITKTSNFLPNSPISNEEMEEVLGLLNGSSRVKRIILRNNGILTRYYAINKKGEITHTNAEITYEAVKRLFDSRFQMKDAQILSVGTTTPDQLLPSHAAMVHGLMGLNSNLEINSVSGACSAGMAAFKYGFMSVYAGLSNNAIVAGSERTSTWMSQDKFEDELLIAESLEKTPILSFQKEFIRWMLSDGAGAFLLENKPNPDSELNIEVEWVDGQSFANEIETCMYAGADKMEDGEFIPWSHYPSNEWSEYSIFALKQDVKLLDKNIISKGVESLGNVMRKHNLKGEDITYFLPHISSYFFKDKLLDGILEAGLNISKDKFFSNLDRVGNVGAGSIFLMFDELLNSGKLKKGDKILLSVPESARFNYVYSLLTVV